MGRIARLLLVLVVGGIPAAIVGYFMLLPGLSEFTTYPTSIMAAYIGCAVGAIVVGPLGLLFALLAKTPDRTAVLPAPAPQDEADYADPAGDDGFGSDDFDDASYHAGTAPPARASVVMTQTVPSAPTPMSPAKNSPAGDNRSPPPCSCSVHTSPLSFTVRAAAMVACAATCPPNTR